ncbi:MAG: class I SAM-dependent methyltransferase [Candidatus Krumholzibacteriia bacterium]
MTVRYDKIGVGYSNQRKPDPRIGRQILDALGDARSVLNVGAGSGSYEPAHVPTFAVEPSYQMIQQRRNKRNVVQASAEALPFKDAAVDSVLAVLTVHHWSDIAQGLGECARTSKREVAILTWDPDFSGFWLTQEYFPELLALDRSIFPRMEEFRRHLGPIQVKPVPIPANCIDGFLGAYWCRPEAYLNEEVRSGMSSFSRISNVPDGLEELRKDLASGCWHRTHGTLQDQADSDLGYRLVTAAVH